MDELRAIAIKRIEEKHERIGRALNEFDLTTASIRDLNAIQDHLNDIVIVLYRMLISEEVCLKEPE